MIRKPSRGRREALWTTMTRTCSRWPGLVAISLAVALTALGSLACQPISTAYGGHYVELTPACVQPGAVACAAGQDVQRAPQQATLRDGSDACAQACLPDQSGTQRR